MFSDLKMKVVACIDMGAFLRLSLTQHYPKKMQEVKLFISFQVPQHVLFLG
jgi:hypothetical protein